MLRIEEIAGAMDDDFRYALMDLSSDQLRALSTQKSKLTSLRPVGVSHAEAMAMIAAILANRESTPVVTANPPKKLTAKRYATRIILRNRTTEYLTPEILALPLAEQRKLLPAPPPNPTIHLPDSNPKTTKQDLFPEINEAIKWLPSLIIGTAIIIILVIIS